ncbi:MAG: uroporphyrinogen decarboxylase family protein [Candidatus Brocadiia bacterium]|jgi:uroporphyrinogen decarboxylase|nr:uroporphyrinogen decarboxylase family protein [Candidatus Brocadiia bacterium]
MNSRERVLCSLSWQEPDRAPIQTYLTPEVAAGLEAHFGTEDVLECLGVDFRSVQATYTGRIKEPQDGLTYDMWGTGYRHVSHDSGAYSEAAELPLAALRTPGEVAAYPWPSPDDYDYSAVAEECEKLADYCVCVGGASWPDILNGVSRGRGMEQVMLDVALRDEVGLAIIRRRVEFHYERLKRTLEAAGGRADIVRLGEDCGNQNGRMFSPRDFDEVFRPHLQRFIDLAHEFGARAMLHSCGDTHELMPTFIDMGLDVLDAMQPEPPGMVLEEVRRLCRGRLAFCGLISTQRTLPFGTVDECRAEARHRLDILARGGGYIFAPAHAIQPDTPLENILAVYEEALGRPLV